MCIEEVLTRLVCPPYRLTSHEANGRRTPLQTPTRKPPPLSECGRVFERGLSAACERGVKRPNDGGPNWETRYHAAFPWPTLPDLHLLPVSSLSLSRLSHRGAGARLHIHLPAYTIQLVASRVPGSTFSAGTGNYGLSAGPSPSIYPCPERAKSGQSSRASRPSHTRPPRLRPGVNRRPRR